MKKIKVGTALAAEYVGLGAHGKHTLVNVYSGDILVAEIPAMIPLSFFVEIEPETSGSTEMSLEVMAGDKQLAILKATAEFEAGKMGVIVLPQLPASIPENCEIKLIANIAGYRKTVLKQLKVMKGPVPAA